MHLLVNLDKFHTCFYSMVFLLHLLVHKLPAAPLGKQVAPHHTHCYHPSFECLACVNDMYATLSFWATICITVCPAIRPLSVSLSCLSLTFVYFGQTLGWIKMKRGMEVGLGSGHIVLDGDPAPPTAKGHSPQFSAHVFWPNGWMDQDDT